ncbi:S8 family serine peptidase [Streptomyces sp. NPDC056835]|uniref:S8 family serine peptidase n=1 Tax=Streptomyces sp. NPDC056835 TaxID=3345956 RepID=UPI00368BF7AE
MAEGLLRQFDESRENTFWVYLDSAADLNAAVDGARTKAERGAAVYKAERDHARRTQAGLLRALDAAGVAHTSYWIVNAVQVKGGDEKLVEKLVEKLAARADVARIETDDVIQLPKPVKAGTHKRVAGVEWNVDRINAPKVWDEFGSRGEGIVVANIDTGVDYTHPALEASYRGNNGDGTFDHNYNWFDPSNSCPTTEPCDNTSHGTHTMGTMTGDDASGNQTGVAPGASWTAVKGCESNSCSEQSLIAAGQWIVAPTDLNGQNPRPDLAPDVVNNSWGGTPVRYWYQKIVDSWRAAGIFPSFSNGNAGPGCTTSIEPGMYVNSYSSGSFDIDNAISDFSSRGAGENGEIKPNISAPGENIRSSVPGGGYGSMSGTSMAAPHTTAAVALLWSLAPELQNDIQATEALLDRTAVDTDDKSCGGTAADNNVFGEGRLDVNALATAAPHSPLGTIQGVVTSGGVPLPGAKVVAQGPLDRTVHTGADGKYTIPLLSVGNYKISVSKYAHVTATAEVTVTEGGTATGDVTLGELPSAKVTGSVSSSRGPASGAVITVVGTPVVATADAQGYFDTTLPLGTYELTASHSDLCLGRGRAVAEVTGETVLDIRLPDKTDTFGYTCVAGPADFVTGDHKLGLTGDSGSEKVELPFPVSLYGESYTSGWVSADGAITFTEPSTDDENGALPSAGAPNAALYPFWDQLFYLPQFDAAVYTGVVGTAPHRSYVVEWRNVIQMWGHGERFSVTALIGEDGTISYRYKDTVGDFLEAGAEATIGLENADGTDAFQYSLNNPVLTDRFGITFRTTKTRVDSGSVLREKPRDTGARR